MIGTAKERERRGRIKRAVLRRFPLARMQHNTTDSTRQSWLLWRDSVSQGMFTDGLLGCGATQREAWRDAYDNKVKGVT